MKLVFSQTRGADCEVLCLPEMQGCTWVLLDALAVLSRLAVPLSGCPAVPLSRCPAIQLSGGPTVWLSGCLAVRPGC